MKYLLLLGAICFIYYKLNLGYFFSMKTHMYFGGFVFFYLLMLYLTNYQQPFLYKVANNIHNSNNIQLHELVPDYTRKEKSNEIKYQLADKQLLRCKHCTNPIDFNYLSEYKLSYIIPIQNGGINHMSNLCLLCPNCYHKLYVN